MTRGNLRAHPSPTCARSVATISTARAYAMTTPAGMRSAATASDVTAGIPMSEPRPWTSGPWRIGLAAMGVESSSLDLPPNRVHGYGVRNDFVCDLNDGEYHEYSDHDEQSANATLIALAPEMAEAILGFQYAGEGCLCVDHGIL